MYCPIMYYVIWNLFLIGQAEVLRVLDIQSVILFLIDVFYRIQRVKVQRLLGNFLNTFPLIP